LALSITFAVNIRREVLAPPDLEAHVEELFENENYDEAVEVCETNPSWFSTVLLAGLARMEDSYQEIEKAMREANEEESARLFQRVGYLNLIANIAPMLGLLGTVWGMIKAFMKIAQSKSQPRPNELAEGISMALVTTLLGLIVAIPVMAVYTFFRNRVENMSVEISNITEDLMERFRQKA